MQFVFGKNTKKALWDFYSVKQQKICIKLFRTHFKTNTTQQGSQDCQESKEVHQWYLSEWLQCLTVPKCFWHFLLLNISQFIVVTPFAPG